MNLGDAFSSENTLTDALIFLLDTIVAKQHSFLKTVEKGVHGRNAIVINTMRDVCPASSSPRKIKYFGSGIFFLNSFYIVLAALDYCYES